MNVCICVPTFGRNAVLTDTIRSLFDCVTDEEILVVDQQPAHDEATRQQLENWHLKGAIRYASLPRPSLTAARNYALRVTAADIVIFLDDDVKLSGQCLAAHRRIYEMHPDVVGVTGQVYHCRGADPILPVEQARATGIAHYAHETAGKTAEFIGCNHSVKRRAMIAAGGYDEQYVASAHTEDFDAAHRLARQGGNVWYEPSAWLIHYKAPSGGCRVAGSKAPEWTHTANFAIYLFRYAAEKRNRSFYLKAILRAGPLRKEVVRSPVRWPEAWVGLVRGVLYGWRHRKFEPSAEMRAFLNKEETHATH